MSKPQGPVASAIRETLQSPNETDSNWESANVVDGLYFLGRAVRLLGKTQGIPEGKALSPDEEIGPVWWTPPEVPALELLAGNIGAMARAIDRIADILSDMEQKP